MVFKSLLPHPYSFIYSQFNINIGDIVVAGRGHKKASDEEILKAYQETNNIWKAAEKLGMCGQNVWKRLKRLGITFDQRIFSSKEKDCLKMYYERYASEGRLDDLAKIMGRTKPFLARQARELGLTDSHRKKSERENVKMRERVKNWHQTHEHPKGFLGGHHTEEAKEKMSEASLKMSARKTKEDWRSRGEKMMETKRKNGTTAVSRNIYSRCKRGYREDIGIYVRSRWEANYCRFLNFLKAQGKLFKWEYEAVTFVFEGIKRGVQSYTPDFKIWTKKDAEPCYVEIKGYMDAKSKTRLKQMRKYYPEIQLVVIAQKGYTKIKKNFSDLIENWELEK